MYEIMLHGLGGEGVVRHTGIIGMASVAGGKGRHFFPSMHRNRARRQSIHKSRRQSRLRSFLYL